MIRLDRKSADTGDRRVAGEAARIPEEEKSAPRGSPPPRSEGRRRREILRRVERGT
jgi:hypothetical protein